MRDTANNTSNKGRNLIITVIRNTITYNLYDFTILILFLNNPGCVMSNPADLSSKISTSKFLQEFPAERRGGGGGMGGGESPFKLVTKFGYLGSQSSVSLIL